MLTKEQNKIVTADFDDILVIEAYAGCGKTSTLIKFCEKRKDKKILYLAYNKSMGDEAKQKFKHLKNVSVFTMHSLAFKQLEKTLRLKQRILGNIKANDLFDFKSLKQLKDNNTKLKIINIFLKIYKSYCNSSENNLLSFSKKQLEDKALNLNTRISNAIMKELDENIKNNDNIIYEHDFYLKEFQLSNPVLEYDYILVDEAQDLNDCVIDIVLQQKAKKVFIGDTYQSIYSFRGANNALNKLSNLKNANILYLTQSFRCSPKIGELATIILKLNGAKNDFIGLNEKYIENEQLTIITRTNAILFDTAIKYAEQEKSIYVVGDIKETCNELIDICNLIINKKEYVKNEWYLKFSNFYDLTDFINATNDIELKNKVVIICKYLSQNKSIYELIKLLKKHLVNNMNNADYIITTAHKSKGLEFLNVELTKDYKISLEEKEELNLLYVAITRAKQNLIMPKDILNFIQNNKEK
ncbi:UvrD-helicase domain-containing protein [Campylobacter sp. MG1]|uniref:UvrD-helicase domain-containing protein n=1 Tax=Campylobacter sp. MG1 TaxID=2976332 RepID=UPI00226D31DC|nr:UvrD-helicase domain-containing protein [Campylobacter sp. MG1]